MNGHFSEAFMLSWLFKFGAKPKANMEIAEAASFIPKPRQKYRLSECGGKAYNVLDGAEPVGHLYYRLGDKEHPACWNCRIGDALTTHPSLKAAKLALKSAEGQ
jgi:hypothetical protein